MRKTSCFFFFFFLLRMLNVLNSGYMQAFMREIRANRTAHGTTPIGNIEIRRFTMERDRMPCSIVNPCVVFVRVKFIERRRNHSMCGTAFDPNETLISCERKRSTKRPHESMAGTHISLQQKTALMRNRDALAVSFCATVCVELQLLLQLFVPILTSFRFDVHVFPLEWRTLALAPYPSQQTVGRRIHLRRMRLGIAATAAARKPMRPDTSIGSSRLVCSVFGLSVKLSAVSSSSVVSVLSVYAAVVFIISDIFARSVRGPRAVSFSHTFHLNFIIKLILSLN